MATAQSHLNTRTNPGKSVLLPCSDLHLRNLTCLFPRFGLAARGVWDEMLLTIREHGSVLREDLPIIAAATGTPNLAEIVDALIEVRLLTEESGVITAPRIAVAMEAWEEKKAQWRSEQRKKREAAKSSKKKNKSLLDTSRQSKTLEESESVYTDTDTDTIKRGSSKKGRVSKPKERDGQPLKPYPFPDSWVLLTDHEVMALNGKFGEDRALFLVQNLESYARNNEGWFFTRCKNHYENILNRNDQLIQQGKVWCANGPEGPNFYPHYIAEKLNRGAA